MLLINMCEYVIVYRRQRLLKLNSRERLIHRNVTSWYDSL